MNSFPSFNRLKKNNQFKEVFLKGNKFQTSTLVFHYYYTSKTQAPKLGIAASKRFGNAVQRNYFKRLSRESFRISKDKLPNSIQVVVRPKKEAASLSHDHFKEAFQALIYHVTEAN